MMQDDSHHHDVLLVDGHVHVHDCFDLDAFLDAAASNFHRAARRLGLAERTPGCLMLTECAADDAFDRLRTGQWRPGAAWSVQQTSEDDSLRLERHDGVAMVMIAGRQIVTAERLEVLALASGRRFADGHPIDVVIDQVLSSDAVAVVPWGFGKWTGRRGRVVARLLDSPVAERIFLGDNGGRPALSLTPKLFKRARERGMPILPGSDPFPLPWQQDKAGSYGFVLRGDIDLDAPAAGIRQRLTADRTQPPTFGHRAGLVTFVRANVGIRRLKRKAQA